jgi:hypothetical protein
MGIFGNVEDAIILHVRPLADLYVVHVPTDNRIEPDARMCAYLNLAYHLCAFFNEHSFVEPGLVRNTRKKRYITF